MDLSWLVPIAGSIATTLITIAVGALVARRKRRSLQVAGITPEQLHVEKVRNELVDLLQDQVKGLRVELADVRSKLTDALADKARLVRENRELKDAIARLMRRHPELADERD